MAGFISRESNDELVGYLIDNGCITDIRVQHAFYSVDRTFYCTLNNSDVLDKDDIHESELNDIDERLFSPTSDQPFKSKYIHLSAPHIYASIIETLGIQPAMAVLNIGSGSGYLSSIISCLLGPLGINHGVELNDNATRHSIRCFNEFKQKLDDERVLYDNTDHPVRSDDNMDTTDTTTNNAKDTDPSCISTNTSAPTSTSTATNTTTPAVPANTTQRYDRQGRQTELVVQLTENRIAVVNLTSLEGLNNMTNAVDTDDQHGIVLNDDDLNDLGIDPLQLLREMLRGAARLRRPRDAPIQPKPIFRPPELCPTTFINANAFELNANNSLMRYDRVYVGACSSNVPFFIQFLNVNGVLVMPYANSLIKVERLSDYHVTDTSINQLTRSTSDTTSDKPIKTLAHLGQPHIEYATEPVPKLLPNTNEYKKQHYIYLYNTHTNTRQRYIQQTLTMVGFASIREPTEYILNSINISMPLFQPELYNAQSIQYQNSIDAMLMLQRRSYGVVSKLPMAVLLNIFEMCPRQWFDVNDNSVYNQAYNDNESIIHKIQQYGNEGMRYENDRLFDQASTSYTLARELSKQFNKQAELTPSQLTSIKSILSHVSNDTADVANGMSEINPEDHHQYISESESDYE